MCEKVSHCVSLADLELTTILLLDPPACATMPSKNKFLQAKYPTKHHTPKYKYIVITQLHIYAAC